MRNWYYKPTRYSLLETDNKTSHYQIACQTCETREKPVAVFWYRNLAPIAGACVTGVRFSQTVKYVKVRRSQRNNVILEMEEGPHIECVDRIAVHRRQYLLFVGPGQREALTALYKTASSVNETSSETGLLHTFYLFASI